MERLIDTVIVDDDPYARELLRRQLSQHHPQINVVAEASNGKEGYDILLKWAEDTSVPIGEKCSLVLSDVEMPVMDGYTLTKNIKEHSELSSLKVMLHSSLSGAFNESMVKKVGADDFIAKYDATELAGRVLGHLKLNNNTEPDKAA